MRCAAAASPSLMRLRQEEASSSSPLQKSHFLGENTFCVVQVVSIDKYARRQLVVLDNPLQRTTTASGLALSAPAKGSCITLSASRSEWGVLRNMTGWPS